MGSATDQAESRIENYLAGPISRIDELEVEILPFNDFYGDRLAATTATSGILLRQLRLFIRPRKLIQKACEMVLI